MGHPPTWFNFIPHALIHDHSIQTLIVTAIIVVLIIALSRWLTRNLTSETPSKAQNVAEAIVEFLDKTVVDIIGPHGHEYVPYVGTLFFYILFLNLFGLIPGFLSPTSALDTTAALAIVTFFYVQAAGIRANGFGGYLMHFVGEPKWLGPLNFPLHIIGELAKPLSLAIRLFGNIFGEDLVILILLGFSVKAFFVPVHLPMVLFGIFTSVLQALIFSMLTCIYLVILTAHNEEH